MIMQSVYEALGAQVASDGIPLHFGDQAAEFRATHHAAVLMDRSHGGRLRLSGRDRLALPHRLSTNDIIALEPGQGAATLFTSPIGRILERAVIVHRGDDALLLTEPGRGEAMRGMLQRNIFFNDEMGIADLSEETRQFALHGAHADALVGALLHGETLPSVIGGIEAQIDDIPIFIVHHKPLVGDYWTIIVGNDAAPRVWSEILRVGAAFGILPAGSLTYNALRIGAGRPGVGRELSVDYLPLEVGLWDEVSFTKGCYTGQEILARMESRGKLARTMVKLALQQPIDAPVPLTVNGHTVGTLTSATVTPTGEAIGIGVVKVAHAQPGIKLYISDTNHATITAFAGVQPSMVTDAISSLES